MFLQSTLWKIFLFIAFSSLMLASGMIFLKWEDIKKETFSKLLYTNELVQHSMNAVLKHQETVLSILGKRLLDNSENTQDKLKLRKLINETLINNPATAGFGLADIKGNLILTSSNLNSVKLPNLLAKKETAKSFNKALNSDGMVFGRTYYFDAVEQWIVPVRFRLTNVQDSPIAVMTAGFVLNDEDSPWNDKYIPNNVTMMIYKKENSHFYRQFKSGISKEQYTMLIGEPIQKSIIMQLSHDLFLQHGIFLKEIKNKLTVFPIETIDGEGNQILNTIQYDPKYDLYTIISQKKNSLYLELNRTIIWLSALVIIFNLSLFFLFRFAETTQKKSKRILQFQATHDALTQLPNRHYLHQINNSWKTPDVHSASLLFIDLEHFKMANDFYGHITGDAILIEVAKRLQNTFTHNIVIRIGGDEFIVLLINLSKEDTIKQSEAFSKKLNQTIQIKDTEFHLTARTGISYYPEDGNNLEELLRKSDLAMYEAKRIRTPHYAFSPQLEKIQKNKAILEKELSTALKNQEFHLVYQPQIDAKTHKILGVETLLRWKNKELGLIPPDIFIPIAESIGLMNDIGHFVLEESLHDLSDLCQLVTDDIKSGVFLINNSEFQLMFQCNNYSMSTLQNPSKQ